MRPRQRCRDRSLPGTHRLGRKLGARRASISLGFNRQHPALPAGADSASLAEARRRECNVEQAWRGREEEGRPYSQRPSPAWRCDRRARRKSPRPRGRCSSSSMRDPALPRIFHPPHRRRGAAGPLDLLMGNALPSGGLRLRRDPQAAANLAQCRRGTILPTFIPLRCPLPRAVERKVLPA